MSATTRAVLRAALGWGEKTMALPALTAMSA